MGFALTNNPGPSRESVSEVLNRVQQTARSMVTFLETWIRDTRDAEIHAGLSVQLADERRHLRLLTGELRRLTRSANRNRAEAAALRPFLEAQAATLDIHRICIIHRGVKAFTLDRLGHLIPLVDIELASVLEQVAQDYERDIRWADIRLVRHQNPTDLRQFTLLSERAQHMLEVAWSRDWARITGSRHRR